MRLPISWIRVGIAFLIISFVWLGWIPFAPAHGINFPTALAAVDVSATASESICVDTGQKIDLNNANLMAFTDCPGFYPTLATLIVQHGPYEQVEAVLDIPDLSEQQQQLLQANLDFFTVSTPVVSLEMRMPPRTSR